MFEKISLKLAKMLFEFLISFMYFLISLKMFKLFYFLECRGGSRNEFQRPGQVTNCPIPLIWICRKPFICPLHLCLIRIHPGAFSGSVFGPFPMPGIRMEQALKERPLLASSCAAHIADGCALITAPSTTCNVPFSA